MEKKIFTIISYFGGMSCGAFITMIIQCHSTHIALVGGALLSATVMIAYANAYRIVALIEKFRDKRLPVSQDPLDPEDFEFVE